MIHEDERYNKRVQCIDGSIPDDEPVFLLRGTDPSAYKMLSYWTLANKQRISPDKNDSLMKHAEKMRDWYENAKKGH